MKPPWLLKTPPADRWLGVAPWSPQLARARTLNVCVLLRNILLGPASIGVSVLNSVRGQLAFNLQPVHRRPDFRVTCLVRRGLVAFDTALLNLDIHFASELGPPF